MASPELLRMQKDMAAMRREIESLKKQVARKDSRPAWGGGGGGGGVHYAETKTALDAISAPNGELGYVTNDGDNTGAYRRVEGAWLVDGVIHTSTANKPPGSLAWVSSKGFMGGIDTTHVQ